MQLETIEERRHRLNREHIRRVAGQLRREHWARKAADRREGLTFTCV